MLSTLALYEWLRRPRSVQQLEIFDAYFPSESIVTFGTDEARAAGSIYQRVKRARTREVDIAIAGCAIEHDAALWTLNQKDFNDIPGLTLYSA